MAVAAHDMTDSFDTRLARLESDVAHIQNDVRDIKIDLRQMRDEFTTHHAETRADLKSLEAKLDDGQISIRTEMKDEFKAVRTEMKDEFKAVRAEMYGEFKAVRTEMQSGFSAVRADMTAQGRETIRREWAIATLMITVLLAVMGVMLRGFGWIG